MTGVSRISWVDLTVRRSEVSGICLYPSAGWFRIFEGQSLYGGN